MISLRYIHAADLHLDTAFRGIGRVTEELGAQLQAATFTALERLVVLCEKEKPDFLVIAGDIYNEDDHSLKAQLALRDACQRLFSHDISVFIVHGNHDPLSSRLQMIQWPENTHIFGDTAQHHMVMRKGEPIAVVHGISHTSTRESRNLAKEFSRFSPDASTRDLFQLGILHCALDHVPPADRYAPCSLEDLKSTGLDAWALGHVHERRIVSTNPLIVYPGNTQGLHINERGPKGCFLVSVEKSEAQGVTTQADFHTLGPAVWENSTVSVDDCTQIDTIEQSMLNAIEEAVAQSDPQCTLLMLRLCLTGRTDLDGFLRQSDNTADMLERLRKTAWTRPYVWVKDIVVETAPMQPLEELRLRDDLLGETLRHAQSIEENIEGRHAFVHATLAPVFSHYILKNIVTVPEGDHARTLLEDAQRLCADLMENE